MQRSWDYRLSCPCSHGEPVSGTPTAHERTVGVHRTTNGRRIPVEDPQYQTVFRGPAECRARVGHERMTVTELRKPKVRDGETDSDDPV